MSAAVTKSGEEAIAIFTAEDDPIAACIVYVSDAFARMSGYTVDQLVGHSALLLAGARPRREDVEAAREARRDQPYVAVNRKRRPDGSEYDALVRLEMLEGEERPLVLLTQRELHR